MQRFLIIIHLSTNFTESVSISLLTTVCNTFYLWVIQVEPHLRRGHIFSIHTQHSADFILEYSFFQDFHFSKSFPKMCNSLLTHVLSFIVRQEAENTAGIARFFA